MAELLKDNLEVERRALTEGEGGQSAWQSRATRREVPDLIIYYTVYS